MHSFPPGITANAFPTTEYKNTHTCLYTYIYMHLYVLFILKIPFKIKTGMFSFIFLEGKTKQKHFQTLAQKHWTLYLIKLPLEQTVPAMMMTLWWHCPLLTTYTSSSWAPGGRRAAHTCCPQTSNDQNLLKNRQSTSSVFKSYVVLNIHGTSPQRFS